MSVASHGYSLRPRGGGAHLGVPGSGSNSQPSPVSPTKRKKDESFSDEEEGAGDKLHEFHKVKISTKTNTERKKEQHHQNETTYSYAPGSWGYITSKGGRKENQDFYIVPPNEAVDMANPNTALLFGVFDGHGIKGLEAARESGRDINNYFNRTNNLPSASSASPSSGSTSTILPNAKTQEWVDVTLHDAFRHAQEVLLQIEANNKQVLDYGTTACVAVIRPSMHEMTIAWVGDARAAVVRWETVVSTPRIYTEDSDSGSSFGSSFLGNNYGLPGVDNKEATNEGEEGEKEEDDERKFVRSPLVTDSPDSPASSTTTVEDNTGGGGLQPTLQVVELTSDHVPEREDERERVLKEGGVIRRVGGVVRVVAGGSFTEEQLKQQRLALNMKPSVDGTQITRSLGHAILSQYGISPEPDVLRTNIQPDDILIIASDGLWNELSSSEISSIALECKMAGFSPQKFCNMLLRRAEVVAKLKGILSDNITIVVYHHH